MFVPHCLTSEQTEDRVTSCQDIIVMADVDNFFNKIITGDDTWCFTYDPNQSHRVLNGLVRHPQAEKTEIPKVSHQDHIYNFFNSQVVVHKEFKPEGKTVNAEFYIAVTDRLLKRIQRVRPVAFCSRYFVLLHNNAPAHKAASFCKFLTRKNVTTFCHSP